MRYPRDTPYQGAHTLYDAQIEQDDLIRRLVYGKPKPLLRPHQRVDASFYGRLIDALANAHAVLVKECARGRAYTLAAEIRRELPLELYQIGVLPPADDGTSDAWAVMGYNRVMRAGEGPPLGPQWFEQETDNRPAAQWVDVGEASRILGVSIQHTLRLAKGMGAVDTQRYGGRSRALIRRDALPALANRPGRHKRKRRYDV